MPSLICVICLEGLETKTAMSTTCGHVCCSECAQSQFAISPRCPVCRTPQTFHQLIRLFPEFGTPAPDPPPSAASAPAVPRCAEVPYLEREAISFRWHVQQVQSLRRLMSQLQLQQQAQMLQIRQIRPPVWSSRQSTAVSLVQNFGMLQPWPRPSPLDDLHPFLQSLQEVRHIQGPADRASYSSFLTLRDRSVQLRVSRSRRR